MSSPATGSDVGGGKLKDSKYRGTPFLWFVVSVLVLAVALLVRRAFPDSPKLPSGQTVAELIALLSGVGAFFGLCDVATRIWLGRKGKPVVEGGMIARLYRLAAGLALIMVVTYSFGRMGSLGQVFALFGGMILGWSLQAPVSGFAAWVLVSAKRPFRPGDRIQFPSLALTGDVKDVGLMYTMLDQVGGAIGSEEAVGRYILVPNAMLFSQVVINYTVLQESPYMLDEVIVRITYDSDWEAAEQILLKVANETTADIVETTGVQPYIRSDLYDYGVYLRLRYQTRVQDRVQIQYEITKAIFKNLQKTRSVDLAIPYVYSYRAGADRKEEAATKDADVEQIRQIPVERVRSERDPAEPEDIRQLAQSIAAHGLLQPIVVVMNPRDGMYDIVAGHLRFDACKHLGWKTVPAVVREAGKPAGSG